MREQANPHRTVANTRTGRVRHGSLFERTHRVACHCNEPQASQCARHLSRVPTMDTVCELHF